jgi:hypothetical protein
VTNPTQLNELTHLAHFAHVIHVTHVTYLKHLAQLTHGPIEFLTTQLSHLTHPANQKSHPNM